MALGEGDIEMRGGVLTGLGAAGCAVASRAAELPLAVRKQRAPAVSERCATAGAATSPPRCEV